MSGALAGKVVVITGASSGIGEGLAIEAAQRGAKVVLAARRQDALLAVAARCGPDALVVVADVTKRVEVQQILDAAVARFGRVDAWVNNAGRGITRPVLELTDEDLDDMILVNVKSALYGMQVAVAHFQARGAGHLVNVSSMLGRIAFASARSAYGAAKHALNALTTNLRNDLRASHPGIHVSLVLPGVVATEFGLNARHGGTDSRQIPNAQPVEEVARVMADLLEHPRAEVYTRPVYQDQVAGYYAAADVDALERSLPLFAGFRPPPSTAA